MLHDPLVPLNRCMIQIFQMENSQMRKQLLLVIGVMVFMSAALTVEAGQRRVVPAVSRTSVYTKYADGGTGADGTALQVGEVAVHPIGYLAGCDPARPEIPYGTRITLDSPSSIGIRHGYTGQVQNYSVFWSLRRFHEWHMCFVLLRQLLSSGGDIRKCPGAVSLLILAAVQLISIEPGAHNNTKSRA